MPLAANPAASRPQLNRSVDDHAVEGKLLLPSPMPMTHSGILLDAELSFRLVGPEDAPVVLAMGGISANRFVSADEHHPGWWRQYAGPGRAIDTDHFRLVSFDWLGGAGDSTRATRPDFPLIDTLDQAAAVIALLDHLEICSLICVMGSSYGGLVAQQLARHYPQRVDSAIVIAAGYRCGKQLSSSVDARPYLRLSESIDLHRVEPEKISVPLSLVGCSNDQLAPPEDLRQFKLRCGHRCRLWILESDCGNDSVPKYSPVLANILGRHLESVQ